MIIRDIIKQLLRFSGYSLVKVPPATDGNPNALTRFRFGKYNLWINETHGLPKYLYHFPEYSQNLARIAHVIKQKYAELTVIDVGANIGDTVAFLQASVPCNVACIEGDKFYYSILQKNIPQFSNVEAYNLYVTDKKSTSTVSIVRESGTSQVTNSKEGSPIAFTTLDEFIADHSKYKSAKLLKVDTDGFDFAVIRGGIGYIGDTKPVLFIEFDIDFLERNNEDYLLFLLQLKQLGYNKILFYDNYGKFVLSCSLDDIRLIKQVIGYTKGRKSSIEYFDVCIFHHDDEGLAIAVENLETNN